MCIKWLTSDVALECGTTSEGQETNITRYKGTGKVQNCVVKESCRNDGRENNGELEDNIMW